MRKKVQIKWPTLMLQRTDRSIREVGRKMSKDRSRFHIVLFQETNHTPSYDNQAKISGLQSLTRLPWRIMDHEPSKQYITSKKLYTQLASLCSRFCFLPTKPTPALYSKWVEVGYFPE
jgi:hypothetical protein